MPEYRFRLGRKPTGSNLITNGDFTANLNSWLCEGGICPSANWAWDNMGGLGVARNTGGCGALFSQQNIFTAGNWYRISYDIEQEGAGAGNQIGLFVGDYGKEYDITDILGSVWTTITKDRICLSGTDIKFSPQIVTATSLNLDNVSVYLLNWNDPLTDEPIGWDNAKIKVERDKQMNGLLTKYINDLTFWGDGYAYLLAQYNSGICNEVPVLIEYRCEDTDTWENLFEGIIYVSDIKWDFSKCQCTTEIEDRNAGTLVIKGKDVKVYPTIYICGSGADLLVDSLQPTDLHRVSDGAYPVNNYPLYNVGKLFRRAIHNATNLQVEFESDFFESGTFEYFAVGYGIELRTVFTHPNPLGSKPQWSFSDLFKEMDKLFNLSFQIYYPNGVPTIKIEPKYTFYTAISAITLNDVPNIKMSLDKDLLYRTVNIGYKTVSQGAIPIEELNFDKGYQYEIESNCSDKELDLVSEYIQDSYIIHDVAINASDEYDDDLFFVECFDDTGNIKSSQFGGMPPYLYNGNIDYDDNMLRWVWSMPADAILQTTTRTIISKVNPVLIKLFEFDFPLSKAEFETIITNPTEMITFVSVVDGINESGYIQEMERDLKTGLTHFLILTP